MKSTKWIWIALVPALAPAQPLPALIGEALRNNREVLAAQKKYEAARQRPSQAASLPDPTVSLGYAANGWPYPGAGLGRDVTSNAGLMFSQEIPFPGKRKLRGEIASKEADAEYQEYLALRLSVAERVARAYHELHHALVGIEFLKRNQAVLEDMMRISEARYSVGRAAQQDVFKAQTELAVLETRRLRFEQEREAKQIELNALRNRPAAEPVDVPTEVPLGAMPASLEELLRRARSRAPALARERKTVEREDLARGLARREYYPDYTVSGGYFNQGGLPPMWQFRVDFKVPAWYRTKQRAGVAESAFAAAGARRDYEAATVSLDAEIRGQYSVAESAHKLAELYERSVIPGVQLTLESSLTGYQTGALDFLSVFSNFLNVVEYGLMYHEEVMRFHLALAKLEELTGGAL
jgi:outer membrane protein TolC